MLKDINGKELSKTLKMGEKDILALLKMNIKQKQDRNEARKQRHKKRLAGLDNRKYMFISDLDVISMMLDAIKKPMKRT